MENLDRRSFIRLGSLSLFGYWGWGDVLRLRAQSPDAIGVASVNESGHHALWAEPAS